MLKTQPHCANTRARWLKKPFLSKPFYPWLVDKGSLTARLQKRYQHFAVTPTMIRYAKLKHDEAHVLRSPTHQAALIREVILIGNQQAIIFAHSVLPRASLRGIWQGLNRLGNQALGATLFANPKVKRTTLVYKKLSANHALYQQAIQHSTQAAPYLWARRSIFSLNCANILVTEVFLPKLLHTPSIHDLTTTQP